MSQIFGLLNGNIPKRPLRRNMPHNGERTLAKIPSAWYQLPGHNSGNRRIVANPDSASSPEQERLLDEYLAAAKEYNRLGNRLLMRKEAMTKADYPRILRQCEAARLHAEGTRRVMAFPTAVVGDN